MKTREMLTIVGVTLAVITAYSLARDLTDEPLGLLAPQTGVIQMQARVNAHTNERIAIRQFLRAG